MSFPTVHFTRERGIAIFLTNNTGAASIKGTLVHCSTSMNEAFEAQISQYDNIGVVYQDDVAQGQDCQVVIAGIAQVLLADGTASTRGNWVIASTADGRADATQEIPPGGGVQEHDEHFKEVGHCLESKAAGTSVLAKIILHFN